MGPVNAVNHTWLAKALLQPEVLKHTSEASWAWEA